MTAAGFWSGNVAAPQRPRERPETLEAAGARISLGEAFEDTLCTLYLAYLEVHDLNLVTLATVTLESLAMATARFRVVQGVPTCE